MQLNQLAVPTRGDAVLDVLRDAIVCGRFRPGQRLGEADLAQNLGVSRGPVRAALQLLETEGLVTILSHRGCFVRVFSDADVLEIYTLRGALEKLALDVIFSKSQELEVGAVLVGIVEQMRAAVDSADWALLIEHDRRFHRTLCEQAGHMRLLKVCDELQSQVSLILNMQRSLYATRGEIVEDHQGVVDALLDGDKLLAAERLLANFDDSVKYLTTSGLLRGSDKSVSGSTGKESSMST